MAAPAVGFPWQDSPRAPVHRQGGGLTEKSRVTVEAHPPRRVAGIGRHLDGDGLATAGLAAGLPGGQNTTRRLRGQPRRETHGGFIDEAAARVKNRFLLTGGKASGKRKA